MLSLPRANVDARDPDSGWTALQFASRQGKLAAVRVLLENQAFVGERAPDGRTPLHFAAGWGTFEVRVDKLAWARWVHSSFVVLGLALPCLALPCLALPCLASCSPEWIFLGKRW